MELGLILNTIGFTTIDENLQNLIEQMSTFPESSLLGTVKGWGKIIGLCIALGVGSYECWMMMLGRRGMDVMKILRIIIISLCISSSGWICTAAEAPGKALSGAARDLAISKNLEVQELELTVQDLQEKYIAKIDTIIQRAQMQAASHDQYTKNSEGGLFDIDIGASIEEIKNNLEFRLKKLALTIETKITEFISLIIRYIGEVIFQISYYGIILAAEIFIHLLWAFCPIAFAMSLAPPYRSAWSQWLSKFISLTLWGFIAYMILYYVNFIMMYNLNMDITAYTTLINESGSVSWEDVGALGMRGLGTTCMYIVGLLVGVYILRFVPEVASWLVPGGISSAAGGAAVGMATGMANKAAGAVTTPVKAVVGAK